MPRTQGATTNKACYAVFLIDEDREFKIGEYRTRPEMAESLGVNFENLKRCMYKKNNIKFRTDTILNRIRIQKI